MAEAQIGSLQSRILQFSQLNHGVLPSEAELLSFLANQSEDETYLLTDPWGEPVQYVIPAQRSRHRFDIFSKGHNEIPGDDDDIGNWDSVAD